MNHFFKNNPFLVFYMVGSFVSVVSLLAQGKLVSALLIIYRPCCSFMFIPKPYQG